MAKAIRPLYEAYGAEGYYRQLGDAYENPHAPEIEVLLRRNLHRIGTEGVLDFAAGGGEVTRVLQSAGVTRIAGADPYTADLYRKNTGLPCEPWSFDDVVRFGIAGRYSAVVCSFALHLCAPRQLFSVAWNLLQAAPLLVVLTPHKRPELEAFDAFVVRWEDHTLTPRGKRVRMKAYALR
jgi:hypothetical protein